MVPLGTGRSQAAQPGYTLPLPARPAEDAAAPRFHSASAEAPEIEAKPQPKRPWCDGGQVVGRGAGFCEVGLAPERHGAPALLALY
jgi:hypothetical protein